MSQLCTQPRKKYHQDQLPLSEKGSWSSSVAASLRSCSLSVGMASIKPVFRNEISVHLLYFLVSSDGICFVLKQSLGLHSSRMPVSILLLSFFKFSGLLICSKLSNLALSNRTVFNDAKILYHALQQPPATCDYLVLEIYPLREKYHIISLTSGI